MLEAILKTIEKSGKNHKSLCIDLDIDPAHWSRILKGEAHFPASKIVKFCEICEDNAIAEMIAKKLNCVLVPISQWERSKDAELRYKHVVEYERDIQK